VFRDFRPFQLEAASASVTIESEPGGADVRMSGVSKGRTPLTLSLMPGEHAFELVRGTQRKPVRVVARAGAAVVHHVEFDAEPPMPRTASLRVTTDPANLRISVDGEDRGMSPFVLENVEPGTHTIHVFTASKKIERTVQVAAGESASVMISAAPVASGPIAGWLTIKSSVTLQVVESGDVIGSSASARILLPSGTHDLRLVNESVGFAERRVVQIKPGGHLALDVDLPKVPLGINAVPWAEVWVDGARLGATPIGNYRVRVGTHDVVFRHPEFGERRKTVTVSLNSPARVSIDMRKSGS
jgi:hypothetical protein